MRIQDSVVIVTGASQGIGRETAILLAKKGAKVWAAARSEDKLKQLAADHDGIEPFACDVAKDEDRAALVQAAGEVDILVNNAGLGWMGLVEDMPADQVRKLFEVNVLGLIDLTQRVLPGMIERRHGHIANVSSVAGWVAMPPLSVYSATKFAVNGFTDGLRRELGGRGVSVSLINPGPIDTGFTDRAVREDAADTSDKTGMGIPATVTAHTIYRSIRFSGVPGYATMASPRVVGLSRLAEIPGLSLLLDVAAVGSRRIDFRRRND
jgi:short-subunit dehydrogenase